MINKLSEWLENARTDHPYAVLLVSILMILAALSIWFIATFVPFFIFMRAIAWCFNLAIDFKMTLGSYIILVIAYNVYKK